MMMEVVELTSEENVVVHQGHLEIQKLEPTEGMKHQRPQQSIALCWLCELQMMDPDRGHLEVAVAHHVACTLHAGPRSFAAGRRHP